MRKMVFRYLLQTSFIMYYARDTLMDSAVSLETFHPSAGRGKVQKRLFRSEKGEKFIKNFHFGEAL